MENSPVRNSSAVESPARRKFQFSKKTPTRSPGTAKYASKGIPSDLRNTFATTNSRLRFQLHGHQNDRAVWNGALSKVRPSAQPSLGDVSKVLSIVQTEITYPNRVISKHDCGRMVASLCDILLPDPAKHEDLANKLAGYISTLSQKHCLSLEVVQLDKVMTTLLSLVRRCSSFFRADTLRAIGFILFDNGDRCSKYVDELIKILCDDSMISSTAVDVDVKHLAFNCIANLVSKAGYPILKPHIKLLFSKSFQVLLSHTSVVGQNGTVAVGTLETSKLLSTTLRVLKALVSLVSSVPSGHQSRKPTHHTDSKSPNFAKTVGEQQDTSVLLKRDELSNPIDIVKKKIPAIVLGLRRLLAYGLEFQPTSTATSCELSEQHKEIRTETESIKETPATSLSSEKSTSLDNSQKRTPWRSSRSRSTEGNFSKNLSSSNTASIRFSSNHPDFTSLAKLSESEFSDGGGVTYASDASMSMSVGVSSSRFRSTHVKVRSGVSELLVVLAKSAPKEMNEQWPALLPQRDGINPTPSQPTILNIMLYDPQPSSRGLAALALCALMEQSNLATWLKGATSTRTSNTSRPAKVNAIRSFVPASERLLNSIREVHNALATALEREPKPQVLAQVTLCVSSTVQHTPYDSPLVKEQVSLIPFLGPLLQNLCNPDSTVRTATQTAILSALTASENPLPDVERWLTGGTTLGDAVGQPQDSSVSNQNTLLNHILESSKACNAPPERAVALSLLAQSFRTYSASLSSRWDTVHPILMESFKDPDQVIRLNAAKVLEEITRVRAKLSKEEGSKHTPMMLNLSGWSEIVVRHLPRAFCDTFHSVRASAANSLSQLLLSDWNLIAQSASCKEIIQSVLDGLRDKAASIRTATSRVFESMSSVAAFKNSKFVHVTLTPMLGGLADDQVQVRSRMATSIANLCFTPAPIVVGNDEKGTCELVIELNSSEVKEEPILNQFLNLEMFLELFESCLQHVDDHDKVSSACLRAIGYLARWGVLIVSGYTRYNIPSCETEIEFFGHEALQNNNGRDSLRSLTLLVLEAIRCLKRKTSDGNAKVNWNACHAIAHIVRGNCIQLSGPLSLRGPSGTVDITVNPLSSGNAPPGLSPPSKVPNKSADETHFVIEWLQALEVALEQSSNFKVRIAACGALYVGIQYCSFRNPRQGNVAATLASVIRCTLVCYWNLQDRASVRKPQERAHLDDLKTNLENTLTRAVIHMGDNDLRSFCDETVQVNSDRWKLMGHQTSEQLVGIVVKNTLNHIMKDRVAPEAEEGRSSNDEADSQIREAVAKLVSVLEATST